MPKKVAESYLVPRYFFLRIRAANCDLPSIRFKRTEFWVCSRDVCLQPGMTVEEAMLRIVKQAVWLISATILLGCVSLAQGRNDDYNNWSDDHRHDRRHHDDRDRNDHHWYNRERDHRYRDNRRDEDWKYRDRNNGWRDRERNSYYRGGRYDYWGGSYRMDRYDQGNRGYSFGYQDGAMVAREDMQLGKPYHPDPRGKYEDADRGYDRYWGDKSQYRSQYAEGYRRGYVAAFRGRY